MPSDPVLIVDDDAASLKLARVLLEAEGYEVRTARDAERALELLEEFRPRLVLVDIQLPGMDGLELTRRLKSSRRDRDIRVVVVTAYSMAGDEARARAAGCDAYLVKPIDRDVLPSRVGALLGHPKGLPALRPRVLLVEPPGATRAARRIALVAAGHDVLEAHDAAYALALVREHPADLVTIDLSLPHATLLALTGGLRALPGGADAPIVGLADARTLTADAWVRPEGLDDLVVTPLEPAQLVQRFRRYLPSPREEPVGRGRRLLVVDDDPVQLKLAGLHLTQAGYEVTSASDAEEALGLARAERPDLILTDVLMPGMDGYDLCLAVRGDPSLRGIPVVLLSSHHRGALDDELAREAGADAFLVKAADFDAVVGAVTRRLAWTTPVAVPSGALSTKEARERRVLRLLELETTLNGALVQRCARQAAQLETLGAVADVLGQRGEPAATIRDVLRACVTAGGVTRVAVFRPNEGSGTLQLTEAVGFSEAHQPLLDDLLGEPELFQTEQVQVLPSAATPLGRIGPALALLGLSSALLVPLGGRRGRAGVLLLGADERSLAELDHGFGRALGAYVLQALEIAGVAARAPWARITTSTAALAPPPASSTPPMSILIVGDDAHGGAGLEGLLRARGHDVRLAQTGAEGLATARGWLPQVVVCGPALPDMPGHGLARSLRTDLRTAGIKLVALTGSGRAPENARTGGFDLHLAAPIDVDHLERIMARLVAPPGRRPMAGSAEGRPIPG